ncbi:MAG: hypothetical protein ACI9ME_001233 [Ilumatobacter sp.]|jgi:hypothetical protein
MQSTASTASTAPSNISELIQHDDIGDARTHPNHHRGADHHGGTCDHDCSGNGAILRGPIGIMAVGNWRTGPRR